MPEQVKVTVTEKPQTVTVEYKGKIHKAKWKQDGTLTNVEGSENLCKAALNAWDGTNKFTLTDVELGERSDGWWSVGDEN